MTQGQPSGVHLPTAVAVTAAVASGAMVALQARINADLGARLDDPLLAALVSFGSGLAVLSVLVLRAPSRRAAAGLRDVPVWRRLGGLGGATLVAVGATAVPRTGVAVFTIGLVAGATVSGLLVDRWGLAPGGVRPVTAARAAGVLLCLGAVAISAAEGVRSASAWLVLLVVLAGGLTAVQQALNGHVRHATDATVATFVNFVVGTVALAVGYGAAAPFRAAAAGSWPGPGDWHLYLGGVMGASFVALAAVVVRSLGVLRLGLSVTAGQLLGSLLLDLGRGVPVTTAVAAAVTLLAVALSGWRPR